MIENCHLRGIGHAYAPQFYGSKCVVCGDIREYRSKPMNELEAELLKVTQEVLPQSPIVDVSEAIVKTVSQPTLENVLNDIELATRLVREFKDKLSSAHPSVIDLVKLLF